MALVQKHVDGLKVTHKDLSFGGDMRDITVSFAKIKRELAFEPRISVDDGIREVRDFLRLGLIKNGTDIRLSERPVHPPITQESRWNTT